MEFLPNTVCSQCSKNIDLFFNFVKDTQRVDKELRQKLLPLTKQNVECEEMSQDVIKTSLKGALSSFINLRCPVCLKKYSRKKNLQIHKRRHKSLFCEICDNVFEDICSRKVHSCAATYKSCISTPEVDLDEIPLQRRIQLESSNKSLEYTTGTVIS